MAYSAGAVNEDDAMLQFNVEILADVIAGITLSIATIVCTIQGARTRNNALGLLGMVSLAFVMMVFLQAASYIVIQDNFELAMLLKQLSVDSAAVSYVIMYIFVNYVWFERMRFLLLIPVIVLALLEIASVYFTDGLVVYTYFENETLIATTIGKAGYLLIFETILANGMVNLVILVYFIKSYVKAPQPLKRPLRIMLLYMLVSVVVGLVFTFIVRFFSSGMLKLFIFGFNYLLIASAYVLITALAIRNPKLLCILPFCVDRLLIIDNKSGLPLFDFQFSTQKIDDILFSGLIQGLQQMSIEVLQKGQIKQISLESGVLTFRKMNCFTVGLLASRNSQMLDRSFNAFTNAFEKQFGAVVQQFNGNRNAFDGANSLVHEYFGYVPINIGTC